MEGPGMKPRNPSAAARSTSARWGGRLDLELVIGWAGSCRHDVRPGGDCPDEFACFSVYDNEESREGAWWAHRDLLLTGALGSRPAAFWDYEAPAVCRHQPPCELPGIGRPQEAEWLAFHGALSARERAQVLRMDGPTWQPTVDAVRRGEDRRRRDTR